MVCTVVSASPDWSLDTAVCTAVLSFRRLPPPSEFDRSLMYEFEARAVAESVVLDSGTAVVVLSSPDSSLRPQWIPNDV
ncbi:hypothetical protein BDR04DRAFT_1164991 [Suillus decipiens]|nr:hypothetical protein BDR04DRAFT_1164991 [Suillus decipiens]